MCALFVPYTCNENMYKKLNSVENYIRMYYISYMSSQEERLQDLEKGGRKKVQVKLFILELVK